ncbi:MAG TPA: radical SAM protein [Verrucomicrobia bacterium]|nr:radical SAM protein [Verrucomicrobiota bacterium]
MYLKMAKRVVLETDKRLLGKFILNFGWRGMQSVRKFKKRLQKGEYFPAFLYISIINSCNLRCQGCWVDVASKQEKIDVDAMNRMIDEAKEVGNRFFGILGGEPFMHKELLPILRAHPECYFQVFTNGQLITDSIAAELKDIGNTTPLVSVEGSEIISNERRRGKNVYQRTMAGLQNCLKHKLLTGVCTSLCQTNIDDLLCEEWIDRLIEMGVMYTWYHTYRPVGPDANEQLSLTPEQQLKIRKFVVEMRAKKPIAIIDAYYDHDGKALCPAATGISHHISPWGGIEPCPIIQFSKESIHDHSKPLKERMEESVYLKDFRETAAGATRGCIVLERPDLLKEVIERHGAADGTARGTAMKELEAMVPRPSQYNKAEQIPEKSFVYRIAKKLYFNDFGAYRDLDSK